MYARIENNIVVEIVDQITQSVIEVIVDEETQESVEVTVLKNLYHESLVFVPCTQQTAVGMVHNNGVFSAQATTITWDQIRARRNELLRTSDWTQLQDSPFDAPTRTAWATYRQALREITTAFSTPDLVVWPTPPA